MDEGGFAPWIRMGAQPTARMDVYVPCLHEFLRERQQPPHVFQHGVEDAKLFCFVDMSNTKFLPASIADTVSEPVAEACPLRALLNGDHKA